jgi:probable HAF family extracellular repeat protein
MRDLDPTSASSGASAINNLGQVVGVSDNHAVLYSNGQKLILPSLGENYATSTAGLINNKGEIVGTAYDPNTAASSDFLYADGKMTNLGSLGVTAINDEGDMVFGHTVLYANGQMIDLNAVLSPNSGWSNLQASAINDVGQVGGTGYLDSQQTTLGFVISDLNPAPEPPPLALCVTTLLGAAIGFKLHAPKKLGILHTSEKL